MYLRDCFFVLTKCKTWNKNVSAFPKAQNSYLLLCLISLFFLRLKSCTKNKLYLFVNRAFLSSRLASLKKLLFVAREVRFKT